MVVRVAEGRLSDLLMTFRAGFPIGWQIARRLLLGCFDVRLVSGQARGPEKSLMVSHYGSCSIGVY